MGASGRQAAGAAGELPQLAAAREVAGHRAASVPFRRLRRRPGREGERRKPRGGGGGGATAGCSRRTGDTRAGKARDLNLSLTRPRSRSLPPSFLTALPLSSQTEPRATCPLYLLLWAGLGVLSCRGCLVYVSGEWQCHASGNCPRRATQDPSRVALLSSLGLLGMGKKENQTLSPSVTSCVCGHGEQLPWMDAALLQEASSIPTGP